MSFLVKNILELGYRQLKEHGIDDAMRDSKLLYCYMNNINTAQLLLEYQQTLQDVLCDRYFDLIDRRCSGEPLQYIIGSQEFMGLTFKVDERVLIPRQDTETMVEDAINLMSYGTLRNELVVDFKLPKTWKVLDLCTGSGAIGVSLAKLANTSKVVMSDVSQDALSLAKENAQINGVEKKVIFKQGDLFKPLDKMIGNMKFDMIVTNPPYIPTLTIADLQVEVRNFEPKLALDGGMDGLDFYKRIIDDAPKYLNKKGILLMEIGHDQGEDIKYMLEKSGKYKNIRIEKDLALKDRVVFALVNNM